VRRGGGTGKRFRNANAAVVSRQMVAALFSLQPGRDVLGPPDIQGRSGTRPNPLAKTTKRASKKPLDSFRVTPLAMNPLRKTKHSIAVEQRIEFFALNWWRDILSVGQTSVGPTSKTLVGATLMGDVRQPLDTCN